MLELTQFSLDILGSDKFWPFEASKPVWGGFPLLISLFELCSVLTSGWAASEESRIVADRDPASIVERFELLWIIFIVREWPDLIDVGDTMRFCLLNKVDSQWNGELPLKEVSSLVDSVTFLAAAKSLLSSKQLSGDWEPIFELMSRCKHSIFKALPPIFDEIPTISTCIPTNFNEFNSIIGPPTTHVCKTELWMK